MTDIFPSETLEISGCKKRACPKKWICCALLTEYRIQSTLTIVLLYNNI